MSQYYRRRNSCIKFVQATAQSSNNAATLAQPAIAGNLLIFGERNGNLVALAPPSGFTLLDDDVASGSGWTWSYKFAAGGETTVTGPTGSTERSVLLEYSGVRALKITAPSSGADSSIEFPTSVLQDAFRSWVMALIGSSGNVPVSMGSGISDRTTWVGGSGRLIGAGDSNGPVGLWSGKVATLGAAVGWFGWSMELLSRG